VPALKAQVLDVGPDRLGDPQPVQRGQGHQRVLGWRSESGSYQEGTELVAVQCDDVGFVVHPRSPDVRRRGVVQEFFFDGVFLEAGDGALIAAG